MATENVTAAITVQRNADRQYELHLKAVAVLRCIRAAAYNETDPAGGDAIGHAVWAVEGMLDEIQEIAERERKAA